MDNIETQLREEGFTWDVVEKAFIYYPLSRDFLRQLVESDPVYKTQLEHHLLMAVHGYSSYPSMFFQNMAYYIQNGLAEQKQLSYYVEEIYMMYREQAEREYNSRQVYSLVDGTGRILDRWIC